MTAPPSETTIHPTAVVLPGSELGTGVEIGPYCVIEPGVEIGDGCRLLPHVHLLGRTTLGANCVIGTGAILGGEPQDTEFKGGRTRLKIGKECRIYEHVTVHRATTADNATSLGERVMMMANSHVGHDACIENDAVLVNGALVAGHAFVGSGAILSGNAAVHQFCRVGRLTLVGGACMVTRDAPPFSIVTGSYPASWRGPNTVGLRRANFNSNERDAVRKALATVFGPGCNPTEAIEEIRKHPSPAVGEIVEFVDNTQRGLCVSPRLS